MSHLSETFCRYLWKEWKYKGQDGFKSLKYHEDPIPPLHGVYLIRTCVPVQRVLGSSDLLYVGQSGGGMKKGVQGLGKGKNNPGRLFNIRGLDAWILKALEKRFPEDLFTLQCYFTDAFTDPCVIERQIIDAYILDHLEPPPGNNQCGIPKAIPHFSKS